MIILYRLANSRSLPGAGHGTSLLDFDIGMSIFIVPYRLTLSLINTLFIKEVEMSEDVLLKNTKIPPLLLQIILLITEVITCVSCCSMNVSTYTNISNNRIGTC